MTLLLVFIKILVKTYKTPQLNSIDNTVFIGKVLFSLERIASTNLYALDLLDEEKPIEGTIVVAHDQYAGRGQVNKHWESEPGKNLTCSIILYPDFLPARQQFVLSQIVALSIADTLRSFIPDGVKIKWPNDLYIFDKKITGTLIQNALQGSTIKSTVIGIGLNVNQINFISAAPNPTSIYLETNKVVDLHIVLTKFCQSLEKWYLKLKAGKVEEIQTAYFNQLFRRNEIHSYRRPDGRIFSGRIQGTNAIGQLVVATEEGEELFSLKEIGYVL